MSQILSRDRGPPAITVIGWLILLGATTLYAYLQSFMTFVTPERAMLFELEAVLYLAALIAGGLLVGLGIRQALHAKTEQIREKGMALLAPWSLVAYTLSQRKYRRRFVMSTLVYGLIYAVITSMIVYQPTVDFVQAYGASLPSVAIAPCCGAPLYSPVVTVYLANHLGLLLIPLTFMMLIAVSVLVGVNFSLAAFAFDSRVKGLGRNWIGGMGATVGLFTGCPTCAGLFFANVLGGTGAISFSALLAYYQPVFIGLSIPVLLATPFLISRSLSKVYRDGCVVLGPEER